MGDPRPTDIARSAFERVQQHSRMAHTEAAKGKGTTEAMYQSHMAISIGELGSGLAALTTGLRATYILLEEVKRLLEQRR